MNLNPIDKADLRAQVRRAQPFPFFMLDDFLESAFAHEVATAFPTFADAERLGYKFSFVNERNKIQITDSSAFPAPILRLHDELASPEFLDLLSDVMEIPNLIADPRLAGGGIHETGPHGHLDVHVDFNYVEERELFRRLNILVYFNRAWQPDWGGRIELWDSRVRKCWHSIEPKFNRCVVFATSEISYHGVTAVTCPSNETRKSFAAYYYTKEAPPNWDGVAHSTLFRARPDEHFKRYYSMPAESVRRRVGRAWASAKRAAKRLLLR
jgi:hypothetical protein